MSVRTLGPRIIQERRIRWQFGLTPSHAKEIARLAYGGVAQ